MREPYPKGRTTIYRGVTMRSRTEASAAQYFDETEKRWEYEPVCFASAAGQYLPDFRLYHPDDPRPIFVEIKAEVPKDLAAIQQRMKIVLDSEPEATLMLMVFRYGVLAAFFIFDADMSDDWLTQEEWFDRHRAYTAVVEEFEQYVASGGTDTIDEFLEGIMRRLEEGASA